MYDLPQFSDETMSDHPQYSDETMSDHPQFSDETMFRPRFRGYGDANTCIFWDVESYPIPNGLDPLSMKEKIKSVLLNLGFRGDLSIQAYGNKSTFSDDKFSDAGIKIDILPEGDKFDRICPMVVDIHIWALENLPPSNLFVITKNIEDEDMIDMLNALYMTDYGVVLSDVEPDWLPLAERSPPVLKSLFDGGNPSGSSQRLDHNKRKADTLAYSEDKSQGRLKYH